MTPSDRRLRAIAATVTLLYRRTLYSCVRTKHTAITGQWREKLLACLTLVEPLAGIGGHGFDFTVATGRAANGRF